MSEDTDNIELKQLQNNHRYPKIIYLKICLIHPLQIYTSKTNKPTYKKITDLDRKPIHFSRVIDQKHTLRCSQKRGIEGWIITMIHMYVPPNRHNVEGLSDRAGPLVIHAKCICQWNMFRMEIASVWPDPCSFDHNGTVYLAIHFMV